MVLFRIYTCTASQSPSLENKLKDKVKRAAVRAFSKTRPLLPPPPREVARQARLSTCRADKDLVKQAMLSKKRGSDVLKLLACASLSFGAMPTSFETSWPVR